MPTYAKEELTVLLRSCNRSETAKILGFSRATLYNQLKKHGISSQGIKFDHTFFRVIDNESKAYWLGFLMADGCVSMTQRPKVTIKLQKRDSEHLLRWHVAIGSCINVHTSGDCVVSSHFSDEMCRDLIKLGCTPQKSLTLKFPAIDAMGSEFVHHFVRGYFDGDGCASIHNKQQTTPQLRLTFVGTKEFLTSLKIIFGVTSKLRSKGRAFGLEITGNTSARRIAEWMYNGATIFLPRKKEVCYA